MNKKWLIIIAIVLVLLSIGVGVYFGFNKSISSLNPLKRSTLPISVDGGGERGGQQIQYEYEEEYGSYEADQEKKLKALSKGGIVGHWQRMIISTSSSSTEIGFLDAAGTVSVVTQEGEKIVNKTNFQSDIIKSKTSDRGLFIAVQFENGQWSLFDTTKKVWSALGVDNVVDVSFSPNDDMVAYLVSDRVLKLYVKDIGEKKKKETLLVVSLSMSDRAVQWWTQNKIVISPKPSAYVSDSVIVVDIKNNAIEVIADGFGIEFAPNQQINEYVLSQSIRQGKEVKMHKMNLDNKEGQALIALTTSAKKCVFDRLSSDLFCAAPYEASTKNPIWPDDYLKRKIATKDKIYQISSGSAAIQVVLNSENVSIDVEQLRKAGDYLYFINRYDDRLYEYSLE